MLQILISTVMTAALMVAPMTASAVDAGHSRLSVAQAEALLHQHKPMTFGVYYYPKQWPEKEWKRDFQGMARLGFDFTHMAEFSWTYLEPEQGKFDFTWLDHAIELAHEAGLRVILGTPSAAPPVWMNRYPEVYRVDAQGQRHQFGIRAENSLANPTYQKFVRQIVTAMAKHYGHDRASGAGRSTTSRTPFPTTARVPARRSSNGCAKSTAPSKP